MFVSTDEFIQEYKEVVFYPAFVCLFVSFFLSLSLRVYSNFTLKNLCLSFDVYLLSFTVNKDVYKTADRIFKKILPKHTCGQRKTDYILQVICLCFSDVTLWWSL